MDNSDKLADLIMSVLEEKGIASPSKTDNSVPVGISNRHIHLSQSDLESCFGKDYKLTPIKDLSQPGQFACKEMVTIVGPKGAIEKVRILGPTRSASQVELLAADNFKLGIKAPLRMSGDLDGSAPVTVVGTKGSVYLNHGAIVAQRHIHMTPSDAINFGVHDGEKVSIEIQGERPGLYGNVVIRVTDTSALDCHLDTEEANAMGLDSSSTITIVKETK